MDKRVAFCDRENGRRNEGAGGEKVKVIEKEPGTEVEKEAGKEKEKKWKKGKKIGK